MTPIHLGKSLGDGLRLLARRGVPWLVFGWLHSLVLALIFIPLALALGLDWDSFEDAEGNPTVEGFGWLVVLTFLLTPYLSAVLVDIEARIHQRSLRWRTLFAEGIRRTPRAFSVLLLLTIAYLGLMWGVWLLGIRMQVAADEGARALAIVILIVIVDLLVLGVVLFALWSLLPTISVLERRLLSSFSRSVSLTKGHRVQLFIILIVISLLSSLVDVVAALAVGRIVDWFPDEDAPLRYWSLSLLYVTTINFQILVGATVSLLFPTVAFLRIREQKEGPAVERVEEIFD